MKVAFATRYRDVLRNCKELENIISLSPYQLARKYMSSVLTGHTETAWWQQYSVYLTETWFIYEYGCENGLIQRNKMPAEESPKLIPINPEAPEHDAFVIIQIARKVENHECGRILLEYAQADDAFIKLIRSLQFECKEQHYERLIGETCGGICDRAAETAIALLQHNYRICVEEPLLRDQILAENYEPEHLYWVMEGSEPDKLELRYPKDWKLHGYVYRAGGRWNGKTVEISICNAHLLDDLIRLYGFRLTDGAKARMDAWREIRENSTIYRQHKRYGTPSEKQMVDRFKEMMNRPPKRIDDLYEDDE